MQKTIQLIPVNNDRESLNLHIPEPDPLVKNNSFQYELLIPGNRSLIQDPFPFLNNSFQTSCKKSKY